MKLPGSQTLFRIAATVGAGVLCAGLALSSDLPKQPVADAAPSELLPKMMDASSSYEDTETAPPDTARPAAAEHARVFPEGLSRGPIDNCEPAQPRGLVPEPVTVLLMASGLVGMIAAQHLRHLASKVGRAPLRSLRQWTDRRVYLKSAVVSPDNLFVHGDSHD